MNNHFNPVLTAIQLASNNFDIGVKLTCDTLSDDHEVSSFVKAFLKVGKVVTVSLLVPYSFIIAIINRDMMRYLNELHVHHQFNVAADLLDKIKVHSDLSTSEENEEE